MKHLYKVFCLCFVHLPREERSMKTISTITNKYPDHNTQKTAFPLCALPLDTPNRDDANLRNVDITTLQVDPIANANLTKGYRRPRPFLNISTDVYGYSVDQAAMNTVDTVRETLKSCPGIEKVVFFASPIKSVWCIRGCRN